MLRLHEMANSMHASEELSGAGITVDTVLGADEAVLNGCINKVGFHRKKTVYMRKVAEICRDKYNSDIPDTIEELLGLPGIGPKMGKTL